MIKDIAITKNNGNVIRGIAFVPDDCNGAYPTVIFSHGFNGNYKGLMHHGNEYAENNIVCIFFDFCGGGVESSSDGRFEDMTLMTEIEDLEDVINAISQYDYVDPNRLFLQGESMGGFVSAYVAASHPELIKALILWYPAFVISDDSRKRIEAGDNTCFGLQLNSEFNTIAANIDIYEHIVKYTNPIRIIHGDMDNIVPLEYSKRAIEVCKRAELIVVPGAGHGYDGDDSDNARRQSMEFIIDNVNNILIDNIVRLEFSAFDKVRNEGGRASCQNDFKTFSVMRRSQYMSWNRTMLEQYLSDFVSANASGRNMIMEKYAYMMESTSPEEYAKIRDKLPGVDADSKAIIEQIVAIQISMMEEYADTHKDIASRARSIHSSEDTAYNTSYETYLRGELSTYSGEMLALYAGYVIDAARNGVNLSETIIGNTLELYGVKDAIKG